MRDLPAHPVPGPLPKALAPIAALGERAYRAEITRRNRNFDRGKGVVTLDRPVISVGNLSTGGTGKTPMVTAIARWLLQSGYRPAIAMRGYKSTPSGPPGGDEAQTYRDALPDVPVIAHPGRLDALLFHFATPDGERTNVVLLDDGFQHRRINRQLDIVLLDASKGDLGGRLLPAGWLREPFDSLARAHAVVLTHTDRATPTERTHLTSLVTANHGSPPLAACRHSWGELRALDPIDGTETTLPLAHLRGKRILPVCAIGNPAPFLAAAADPSLGHAAGTAFDPITLPDHDPYRPATILRIAEAARSQRADIILTTDKDWTKLRRVRPDQWPCPVARPSLTLAFDHGEHDLKARVLETATIEPT